MDVKARMLCEPVRISLVLCLDVLSMTTWMSRPAGTLGSIGRGTWNSGARWRGCTCRDRSRLDVERGKQRRRAVALVVVGAPLD